MDPTLFELIDELVHTAAGCGYHGGKIEGDPFVEEDKKKLLDFIKENYDRHY